MTAWNLGSPLWILCLLQRVWFVWETTVSFNENVTGDMASFSNKGHGQYNSGLKPRILETFPTFSKIFESVTGNAAFCYTRFRISCDVVGLIATVCNIPFLERQGHRQELKNSRSEDDR